MYAIIRSTVGTLGLMEEQNPASKRQVIWNPTVHCVSYLESPHSETQDFGCRDRERENGF